MAYAQRARELSKDYPMNPEVRRRIEEHLANQPAAWRQGPLDKAPDPGTIRAADPENPIDRIGHAVTDSDFYRNLSPEAQRVISGAGGLAEFAPPVAVARGGYDMGAGAAASRPGQMVEGALNAVPEVGTAGKAAMAMALAPKAGPLWHGVSGTKLRRPLDEVQVGRQDTGTLQPRRIMTPDDLSELEGRDMMFSMADRTGAGANITDVGGNRLDNAVRLRGGQDFARENDAAWASAPNVTGGLAEKARGLRAPLLVPFTMAHGGQDFSHMAAGILAEQGDVWRNLPKDDVAAFDKVMREGHGLENKGGKQVQTYRAQPDWPGMHNMEEARAYLMGNPNARKAYVDLLDQKTWQDKGFPVAGEARYAATAPELLDRPSGEVGYSMMNVDPKVYVDPTNQHPAYPTNLGGGYFAALPGGVPFQIAARDHIAARRAAGKPEASDYRSMQTNIVTQRVDKPLIERLRRYYEEGQ